MRQAMMRIALALAAALLGGAAFAADTYPDHKIRLIVPFAAGGPTDVIGRLVAERLSDALGQQVYVENLPGAGGNLDVETAKRAAPDGYTIVAVSTGFIINPSMYTTIGYDPLKDFAPISLVAASPNVVVVHPSVAAKDLRELIALIKAKPNTMSYAQPSTGSTPHLAAEQMKQMFGLDMVTVPFNGAPLAINSALGNHTPVAFTALPPAIGAIKDGSLRGIAILAKQRIAALPDLPTCGPAEARRARLRPGRELADGVFRAHQERGGALGQGSEGRRDPYGLATSLCIVERAGGVYCCRPVDNEWGYLMKLRARNLASCAAVATAVTLAVPAAAADYPDHAVKVIVPFAAGGPTDVMARLIAQKLSENLKQQFYVEDHAGAGGNIGMTIAARAAPDGYTVLVASSSFMVNPSLYATPPFDPHKDLAPVTRAAATPNIVVVHPSIPAKTINELIDLVNANPGKYTFANAGIGTTPQLASELLKLSYHLDATSIPFGGSGPEIQSVLAAQTPIAFSTLPPTTAQVTAGTLRGLAITAAKRSAALPNVPTMAESGINGQESETMQGIFVPAGTPPAIIDRLNREIVKVMQLPDVKSKCLELGFEVVADSPADFAVYIKNDIEKWAKVINDAKIEKIK